MIRFCPLWVRPILLIVLLSIPVGAWSKPLLVAATILPIQYFVQRVGGERVQVEVLVPPGKNHETYEPTPREIAALSRARVFFQVGLPLETPLLPKLQHSKQPLLLVDLRRGIPMRTLDVHETEFESAHDHAPHASSGSPDPHIWLAPELAAIQAATIAEALSAVDPAGSAYYANRRDAFIRELKQLHQDLTRILKPVKGGTLFVYHPAYGYFADAYALHQVPVEIEGKEPTPRELAGFIKRARKDHVRIIFVQPQFSQRAAQTLAQTLQAAVLPLDPVPGDYTAYLRSIAQQIETALTPDPARPSRHD